MHKQVMRNDIKMAAKIIQILDKKWSLWEDDGQEKKDDEKEVCSKLIGCTLTLQTCQPKIWVELTIFEKLTLY